MTAETVAAVRLWKFVRPDLRLCHDASRSWEVGRTLHVKPPLVLCERGFHASERPWDALQYASSERTCIARVEGFGEIVRGDDKVACESMTVLAVADPTAALQRLACKWADRAVRVHAAKALRAVGLTAEADRLAALGEIIDEKSAWAAAGAAGAAAWAAAGAAERDAANLELEAAFTALMLEDVR